MSILMSKNSVGGAAMRFDQYSSTRNVRPGLPSTEEIKKTTEVWRGDISPIQEVDETLLNDETGKPNPLSLTGSA
jgi:hypothetical protein